MSNDIGFDAQAPSLPQGGGAVSGLGETFSPDLSTGTGSFAIRLDWPNGPNDIGPRLSLRYDTAGVNGPFGMGFSLPLPRLLRSTARGFPHYDGADTLLLEGAGELVTLVGGAFRPRVDAGVWRAEASGDGFRLTDRDGLHYFLGTTSTARLVDDATPDGSKVYAWHLERIEDVLGNVAAFTWRRDGNQLYLSTIAYGIYEVQFHYGRRPDPTRWGRAGFLITTALRCDAIELHQPSAPQPLVRRWTLAYSEHDANGCSLLTGLTLSGFDETGAHLDAPPLRLGYSSFKTRSLTRFQNDDDGAAPGPLSRRGRRVELTDWNGNGLPDLLEIADGGRARLWPNVGDCTWGRPQIVGNLPLFASPIAPVAFADMSGDGVADLLRLDRLIDGYVPRIPGGGFGRPVAWRQAPSVSAAAPGARLVDLDGDGVVDLLASSSDYLSLYYRSDPDGWSPRPQVIPRGEAPDVNLADSHVSLADMTGDGSDDLVRVDGSGVTYWPYLGLGRWAEPVTMGNPPTLPYNMRPEHVFLSDIDGDGCADLVCLDQGRVLYWINHVGNRFSDVHEIDYVPAAQISEVRLADMRGSGTAGLVWSTPGPFGHGNFYYYLDFSGDSKPYLLSTIDNGVGLTTEIAYSTSAQQAAADALAGEPWNTVLPVVVPVVAGLKVTDAATGRQALTAYRYHDGRFDGVLREFAGFGRVDEDQLGDATAPTLRTTRSFHIGLDREQSQEPRTIEERRRLRAIRGRMFLQERYGLDGSPEEVLPYERLEQEWTITSVPTSGGPVDIPRLAKTTQSTFERAPNPAAVITTTNTAFDDAGNVSESIQTSELAGDPAQTRTLRTHAIFARDPTGRFLSRAGRVQQFDDTGVLVADTITEFDGTPEATVGAQGLVTRRSALVLSDALVADVYGASPPDFAALGYFRRPGESGWWINQAVYHRRDDVTGLHGTVDGPRGASTTLDFDVNKMFPARITDPHGNTVTAEHDYRAGRVKRLTDASGGTYLASFDALARLTARVEPGDSVTLPTTSYDYNTSVLPVEVVQRSRSVSGAAATIDTREMSDGFGMLLERRVRDQVGEIVVASCTYGARGLLAQAYLERRPTSAVYTRPDVSLPRVTYTYDALGRPIRQQNADDSVRTLTYGPLFVEEADEEDTRSGPGAPHTGTVTRRRFDATGRIQSVEENLGGRVITSTYTYDIKGNLIRHVDAMGNIVRVAYDFLGRTIRVDRPEQGTILVFDAAGNPIESRGRDQTTVLREFDKCNRTTAVRYNVAASAPVVRFTYHDDDRPAPTDAGTHTAGGRCVRIDDEGGLTVFDYDERGRVALKRSSPIGVDRSFDLNFRYRADGQLDSVVYPDGGNGRAVVRYEYDRRGNVVGIPTIAGSIEYDLAARRTRMRLANGTEQAFTYDDEATGRLTGMQLTGPAGILRSMQYSTDLAGNLLRVDSPDPKLATAYVYDDLYRLVEARADSGESFTYRYDDAGNLTRKSDVGDYHYGERGAATTCLTSAGADSFTYTQRGQMEETPWGTQTFDAAGRLTRVISPDGVGQVDFRYDYAGSRVAARSSGGLTPDTDLLTPDALYSIEFGRLVLNFSDGHGIVARQTDGGGLVFLHSDHLGGLVTVTDAAGQVVDSLRYDPYGKLVERTGTGPSIPSSFTGGTPEPASGLLYLGARYYNPSLGRFVSADAIVQDLFSPIAWSPYVYCRGNPSSYVDPSGHSFLGIFLALNAIVALVAVTIVSLGTLTAFTAPAAFAVGLGMIAGGVVGGISAAQHGGNIGEGILVGMAVGGWAAFASVGASIGVETAVGEGTLAADIAAGGVSGSINGAAMGFASGFGGGKGSFDEILKKTLLGALLGAATGASLGALSHFQIVKTSATTRFEQAPGPQNPPQPTPANTGLATGPWGNTRVGPPISQDVGNLAGPAYTYALKLSGYSVGLSPTVTAAVLNTTALQTFIVDLVIGSGSLVYDYAVTYARRHEEIKTPPIMIPGKF